MNRLVLYVSKAGTTEDRLYANDRSLANQTVTSSQSAQVGQKTIAETYPLLLKGLDPVIELIEILRIKQLECGLDLGDRSDESLREILLDKTLDMIRKQLIGEQAIGVDFRA
jgi:hypothetical protein